MRAAILRYFRRQGPGKNEGRGLNAALLERSDSGYVRRLFTFRLVMKIHDRFAEAGGILAVPGGMAAMGTESA
jgi:hypothetical protein